MIETLNDLLAMPGIKKAMEYSFVAKQEERFKLFLGTFYLNALNKWAKKLEYLLSLKTLILINLIIVSYYAGKANAISILQWMDVFSDFHIWFESSIVLNTIYLCGHYIRKVLEFLLYVVIAMIIIYLVYQIIIWISDKVLGTSNPDLSPVKKI